MLKDSQVVGRGQEAFAACIVSFLTRILTYNYLYSPLQVKDPRGREVR